MPFDGAAAQAINAETLATGSGGALAPEVVVDGVCAGLDGAPLLAAIGALGDLSWSCGGHCYKAGRGDRDGELHLESYRVEVGF